MIQLSFIDETGRIGEGEEIHMLNNLQLQAIKDKVSYKNSDYCNVSAEDVKQFLLENNVKLGNRKTKEAMLKLLFVDEELTYQFAEKFFNEFYCNVYDLKDAYSLTFDEAQSLINAELVEYANHQSKKGYPLLTLNALKFTQEEVRQLYSKRFGSGKVKIRLDVENQEQGAEFINALGKLFDVEGVNYHSKREDNRLHCYATLLKKATSDEDQYNQNENVKLQQEVAAAKLAQKNAQDELEKLQKVIDSDEVSITESSKYKDLKARLERALERYRDKEKAYWEETVKVSNLALENKDLQIQIARLQEQVAVLEKSSRRRPGIGTEKEDLIVKLRTEGLSMRKIAQEVKVAEGTIVNVLRKRGLIEEKQK